LNLSYIGVFLIAFPFFADLKDRVYILCFGVLGGGFLQLLVQAIYVSKLGFPPIYNLNWKHPAIRKIFQLMLPAVLGGGFYQLGLLVDIFLANYIQNQNPGLGAVVSLDYSQRLVQFPTGIIGVALATTILPSLLKHIRTGARSEAPEEIAASFRFALFLTLPASLGLLCMGRVILDSIFFGGKWDHLATTTAIMPLFFYSMAIPFFSLNKILISSYYAFQDTKTALKVQAVSFSLSILISVGFMGVLYHAAIAMASAIAAVSTCSILIHRFSRHRIQIPILGVVQASLRFLPGLASMGLWTYLVGHLEYQEFLGFFKNLGLNHATCSRILLLIGILPGILLYFGISFWMGVEEWNLVASRLQRKKKQ
jgi:putative peptidoglycan lipid II flippase